MPSMIDLDALKKVKVKGRSKEAKFKNEVLHDFWICCVSREVSLLGRKEVLTGKAKFGILGDGKEVPQVAMARAFKKGDFRSGYYRDQTFMMALGLCSVEDFFAQLYADSENDPFSGGRQMNAHFATPLLDQSGDWLDHTDLYNVSADISSTGGQMARALGLALASKKYKEIKGLSKKNAFSKKGQEVSFVTIGDASTSEGIFWETINAAGVMQVPLAVSVWDDGYGISVPIDLQTTKKSISQALQGMEATDEDDGILIYKGKAWDYPGLVALYEEGIDKVRKEGRPALFHIQEVTQPQGHSTSGSHERYKSKGRLNWEREMDCIDFMADWIERNGIATADALKELREDAKTYVKEGRDRAWTAFKAPAKEKMTHLKDILGALTTDGYAEIIHEAKKELERARDMDWHEVVSLARRVDQMLIGEQSAGINQLKDFISAQYAKAEVDYHSKLYNDGKGSALKVPIVHPEFSDDSKMLPGYQILNEYFDSILGKHPEILAFGEDVGHIGDVNQGFAGMQEKYGKERVFDAGIREWTIMGQAIGMAMRGLRPIAEIQYLDYLIYGLQPLSDDLATLRYRSNGLQKAPAIIRTRGHRLEGIWHAGSPMGMLIHALRGIYLCVPRNMTQAAGMYQTLLQSDEPGVIVECLNGYRLKERRPDNLGEFAVPMGMPEVLKEGQDITLVTYGSCIRIAESAINVLSDIGIDVELIDAQTLLPFDLDGVIINSLKKTNRIIFMDEDVPGGASSYMMQQVLEKAGGYQYLDSAPKTITAQAHRSPYGSDGDYFTKPNAEDIVQKVYNIMSEVDPSSFPISE